MTEDQRIQHHFVDAIPDTIDEGRVYISIRYGTVIHRCCCGCGEEVVTPLTPTDWKLIFDGATISLFPSIGNWAAPCQSHYWIRENRIEWAPAWSEEEISRGRRADSARKEEYHRAKSRGEAYRGSGWSDLFGLMGARTRKERPEDD